MAPILAGLADNRQLQALAKVDNISAGCCLLCGARARRHCLCPDCLADLPWLPPACAGCALPLATGLDTACEESGDSEGAERCPDCRLTPPPWSRAFALFRYEFPVDRLIAALKYHGRLPLATSFGHLLADRLPPGIRPDVVLPVPVHPRRLRRRGCNQAALLARVVARGQRCDIDVSSLRRRRDTAMQKSLDPQARRDNLANAFAWCGPSLAGRHVLLVDDVMTTGATLACLSLLLRTAGAGEISVLAVARTLPP